MDIKYCQILGYYSHKQIFLDYLFEEKKKAVMIIAADPYRNHIFDLGTYRQIKPNCNMQVIHETSQRTYSIICIVATCASYPSVP